jgi:mono/diheme cytochrome c family protein
MIRLWIGLTATLLLTASAQDGGQLYTTYCGTCHAPNGLGAVGGQFPPLAGSEWLKGSPDRAIQVVLHGLEGPVEVNGKAFNLLMPPQGAALPDDQIAAILTHVRSSWGNEEGKVTTEMVSKARAATAGRDKPWTAPEILKLHPFPKDPSPLRNLISRVYEGEWKKLPNFETLTPKAVEEEHDGIISLKKAGLKDAFGMVWEADFMAEKDGEYYFRFACDDGGRVILDDEVVLEVHGIGPMNGARTVACILDLKKGAHPIRVEYYEYSGNEGIALAWQGPGDKSLKQLTETPIQRPTGGPAPILIEPTAGRAAIYRNFIKGTTPRSIGIGLPGGINFAYSGDHMAPELIWTGAFMDGGLHWTNRGQGAQPPAGENVVQPTKSQAFPEGARFHGYKLDAAGNPTFSVSLGDLKVDDSFKAGDRSLERQIHVSGKGSAIPVLVSMDASSMSINGEVRGTSDASGDREMKVSGPISIDLPDGLHIEVKTPGIRTADPGLQLLLAPGENATLTYSWK